MNETPIREDEREPLPLTQKAFRPLSIPKRIRRLLFGNPLSSEHMMHTLLPKRLALPVFASDAISSVAYATQQIILALGAVGLYTAAHRNAYTNYTMLISGAIVALLAIVVISYWQTIFGYPSGGGSYIVTKDNPDPRSEPLQKIFKFDCAFSVIVVFYICTVW